VKIGHHTHNNLKTHAPGRPPFAPTHALQRVCGEAPNPINHAVATLTNVPSRHRKPHQPPFRKATSPSRLTPQARLHRVQHGLLHGACMSGSGAGTSVVPASMRRSGGKPQPPPGCTNHRAHCAPAQRPASHGAHRTDIASSRSARARTPPTTQTPTYTHLYLSTPANAARRWRCDRRGAVQPSLSSQP